jgi:HD superfamily phosphodiesterase
MSTEEKPLDTPWILTVWCLALLLGAMAIIAALAFAKGETVPVVSLVVLAVLCSFSEHVSVTIPNGPSVSASVMVCLAAVVICRADAPLLGPMLVGAASGIVIPQIVHRRWHQLAFNIGTGALSTLAAALFFGAVAAPSSSVFVKLLAAIVAATAYWVVNVALLSVVLRWVHGRSFKDQFSDLWGFTDVEIVTFAVLGVFLGELYVAHGIEIVALFVVPILVARQGFAAYLAAREGHDGILKTLIQALESKDPYTGGHAERVGQFAGYIGSELGFSPRRMRRLHDAALMHDIGKLVVPNQLLNKPGKLTPTEYERVREHEGVTVDLVRRIDELAPCAASITHAGEDAPIESRIIHVADAFDAMTSTRAYRRALRFEEAVAELRDGTGRQFDATCVEALIGALERRNERYGEGYESAEAIDHFEVAPPVAGVGSAGLGNLAPEAS